MSYSEKKIAGIRKMIADGMMKSIQATAQYSASIEIDATNLVEIKNDLSADLLDKTGLKLTYTPLFVKIVSRVLLDFPLLNSIVDGDTIKTYDEINISVAVDTESGLMVPVLKNVEKKNLSEIVLGINDLIERARNSTLGIGDVIGGTFTISNFGMYGITNSTPILNIPQVAILGIGTILKKPVFKEDKIQVGDILYLSLTADHRIIDGALAARFLKGIKDTIESKALLKSIFY